mmetsp:Transcript_14714/g.17652  ORF Transcript_14714/g.17652 Transcript_14714/m.17652 type:complete len:92 (-) Transcript_14714:311-586(-)
MFQMHKAIQWLDLMTQFVQPGKLELDHVMQKFSRDVKNYRERLQCSLFVRHPNMSDVAGFAMSICLGLTLHYLCGLGFFHVWSEGNLHFTG